MQRLSEQAAIQAVWVWFRRNRHRHDTPAIEIIAKVRALAPGADAERIKSEFWRRFRRAQR